MRAEYKRDVNHNYLILHGDQAVNTASYQVRMLVGNVIPSILKCRLQGLDGEVLFYYEITSRQSVASMYEQRKFGKEDLKLLFGGFIQVMEEMGEYLLNPGYLLLQPEYMFLDVERRQIGFCYLPGEEHEVKTQFRNLTEYVLPRLDHQDGGAVMLGYGVYRRALEDCFHLEHIKEEIYQEKRKEEMENEDVRELSGLEEGKSPDENSYRIFDTKAPGIAFAEERERKKTKKVKFRNTDEDIRESEVFLRKNETQEGMKKKNVSEKKRACSGRRIWWQVLLGCMVSAGGIFAFMACTMLGYLPRPGMEEMLTGTLICLAAGISVSFISGKLKRKKSGEGEENWRERISANRESRETKEQEYEGGLWKREEYGNEPEPQKGEKGYESWRGKRRKEYGNEEEEPGYRKEHRKRENEYVDEPDREEAEKSAAEVEKLRDEIKKEAEKPDLWAGGAFGETVVLSAARSGQVSLVSREPGELAPIYLTEELTVIGKMENASDAVIPMPTVSRIHAKIRRREGEYYLTDLNSRNGTSVNGRMLKGDEEYLLKNEDEVDFAQARYVFLK